MIHDSRLGTEPARRTNQESRIRNCEPLYAAWALAAILIHRARVSQQIGRDPIVIRPFAGDAPQTVSGRWAPRPRLGHPGLLVCRAAIRDMGASWRMAVARAHPGPLVTEGRFRHPIYARMLSITTGWRC